MRGWEGEDYTRGIKDVKEIEGLESLDEKKSGKNAVLLLCYVKQEQKILLNTLCRTSFLW